MNMPGIFFAALNVVEAREPALFLRSEGSGIGVISKIASIIGQPR